MTDLDDFNAGKDCIQFMFCCFGIVACAIGLLVMTGVIK